MVSYCQGSRMCWQGSLLIRLLVTRLHVQECRKADMPYKILSSQATPLLQKKCTATIEWGRLRCFCCGVCNGFAMWFFTGKKKLWRIKIKKPFANVFGTRQTCSIAVVNWDKKKNQKPSLALIDMFTVNVQLLSLKVIQMKIQDCIWSNVLFVKSGSIKKRDHKKVWKCSFCK